MACGASCGWGGERDPRVGSHRASSGHMAKLRLVRIDRKVCLLSGIVRGKPAIIQRSFNNAAMSDDWESADLQDLKIVTNADQFC
jgi:hypothetical protein